MRQLYKSSYSSDHHASKSNRIWFPVKDPAVFSDSMVKDTTAFHMQNPMVKRLPCGLHIFSPFNLPNTTFGISTYILHNLAATGFLIPTATLGKEWKFEFPVETELPLYLGALSLMLTARITHVPIQRELVGNAQPLLALQLGEGSCFERASIFAAICRFNGLAARILGGPNILATLPLDKQQHWWVEVKIGDEWIKFDPSLAPDGMSITQSIFVCGFHQLSGIRPSIDQFLGSSAYLDSLRQGGAVIYVTDEPSCKTNTQSAIIAPEIELPEKYVGGTSQFSI